MFERARSEAVVDTDLIPYWVCEGSARVERRVPMLPFSREVTRLVWLSNAVSLSIVWPLANRGRTTSWTTSRPWWALERTPPIWPICKYGLSRI